MKLVRRLLRKVFRTHQWQLPIQRRKIERVFVKSFWFYGRFHLRLWILSLENEEVKACDEKKIRKLTLINKSFVLPMFVACRNKRMMTNRLLNQHFVLELLNVVFKNYLKNLQLIFCWLPAHLLTFDFSRTFKANVFESVNFLTL